MAEQSKKSPNYYRQQSEIGQYKYRLLEVMKYRTRPKFLVRVLSISAKSVEGFFNVSIIGLSISSSFASLVSRYLTTVLLAGASLQSTVARIL